MIDNAPAWLLIVVVVWFAVYMLTEKQCARWRWLREKLGYTNG